MYADNAVLWWSDSAKPIFSFNDDSFRRDYYFAIFCPVLFLIKMHETYTQYNVPISIIYVKGIGVCLLAVVYFIKAILVKVKGNADRIGRNAEVFSLLILFLSTFCIYFQFGAFFMLLFSLFPLFSNLI